MKVRNKPTKFIIMKKNFKKGANFLKSSTKANLFSSRSSDTIGIKFLNFRIKHKKTRTLNPRTKGRLTLTNRWCFLRKIMRLKRRNRRRIAKIY